MREDATIKFVVVSLLFCCCFVVCCYVELVVWYSMVLVYCTTTVQEGTIPGTILTVQSVFFYFLSHFRVDGYNPVPLLKMKKLETRCCFLWMIHDSHTHLLLT